MNLDRIRHFLPALPIILWLALTSCQDQGNEVEVSYKVSIEDHSTSYSFPSGVYYSFMFSQPYSREFDVEAIFRQVASAGLRPTDAWYKKYRTECHPPGSMIVLPAEVAPALIIRIETADPRMEQLGFVRTQNPSTGFCNYTVTRYAFHH